MLFKPVRRVIYLKGISEFSKDHCRNKSLWKKLIHMQSTNTHHKLRRTAKHTYINKRDTRTLIEKKIKIKIKTSLCKLKANGGWKILSETIMHTLRWQIVRTRVLYCWNNRRKNSRRNGRAGACGGRAVGKESAARERPLIDWLFDWLIDWLI